MELAHATATTSRSATTTVPMITETALTCSLRRSNRLDMYAEQIVLSSNSTCCIRFHLCKEARGSRLRHRQAGSFLEKITARLNDDLAEKLEQHRAQVLGRAPKLGKQLLRGLDIIIFGGAERIDGSMEEDLEHQCKIGVELSRVLSFSFCSFE